MTPRFPTTRRKWLARAGALAAAALASSGCGISLQSLPKLDSLPGPFYHVKAVFANVVNLPANAQVREGAFQVGYVSNIAASNFKATITMAIKKSAPLPIGTTAQVRFDTPLGEDFILLVQPTQLTANSPNYRPGSTIPESQTATAPSVEDVLGALGALLNGGGLNQLHTIVTESVNVFQGNQPQIRSLLNSLNDTVTSFEQNAPAFDRALQAISTLSQTLKNGSSTIVAGINAITPAVQVLAGQNNSLDQLVNQVSQLSQVANTIVAGSQAGTIQSVQALDGVLTQLVNVQQQVGPFLGALDNFERLTPRTAPGDYLQASINASIVVPNVPGDALPLTRVTVDPPDPNLSYNKSAIATILEGGLP
jgi:phospholipid/cholesterol/gamma-HCH transport system substrate-binding protein